MKRYESAALLRAGSLISGRWAGSRLKCLRRVWFEAGPAAVIPPRWGRGTFPNEAAKGVPGAGVGAGCTTGLGSHAGLCIPSWEPRAAPKSSMPSHGDSGHHVASYRQSAGEAAHPTLLRVLRGLMPAYNLHVKKHAVKAHPWSCVVLGTISPTLKVTALPAS